MQVHQVRMVMAAAAAMLGMAVKVGMAHQVMQPLQMEEVAEMAVMRVLPARADLLAVQRVRVQQALRAMAVPAGLVATVLARSQPARVAVMGAAAELVARPL